MELSRLKQIEKEFENNDHPLDEDAIFKGLKILSNYGTNLVRNINYYELYSLPTEDVLPKMSEKDAKELFKLNWFISEEYDCFAKFH